MKNSPVVFDKTLNCHVLDMTPMIDHYTIMIDPKLIDLARSWIDQYRTLFGIIVRYRLRIAQDQSRRDVARWLIDP